MPKSLRTFCLSLSLAAPLWGVLPALAATPTVEQALTLAPVQTDVEFDKPAKGEIPGCVVNVEAEGPISGWTVRNSGGQLLRRFLDTNADNKLDQWCYYKDGIEVYRDLDTNFNNKADQYRWLGTAGTRWGLDKDEDGRIDSWKTISPEEVTAEIVGAIREQDANRFQTVLLTGKEIDALGLGEEQTADLKGRATAAAKKFAEVIRKQSVVRPKSQWVNFGASRPGTIAGGGAGAKSDLVVYDNVSAVLETEGKHSQLLIGALVKTGEGWKVFELPKNLEEDNAVASGHFFQMPVTKPQDAEQPVPVGVNLAVQKPIMDLERVDKALLIARTPAEQTKLNSQRADLLEQIIAGVTSDEDRDLWVRQYAETINAAVQSGGFPDGLDRLAKLSEDLAQSKDRGLTAYVRFRYLSAEYNQAVAQAKEKDFPKINENWIKSLTLFVDDFSETEEAADAKLQLAISSEFSGKEDEAIQWYSRIAKDHPSSDLAKKATGAKRRLQSVGQLMTLKGKTIDAKPFDLAAYKGKVVLIHYWATWCEPCKQDMEVIKQVQAKYGKRGFYPVGISLDSTEKEALAYLKAKALPWTHVYEAGGLESRLAAEMGILTLPTMILVDETGKVVNRAIHAQELDATLGKLLK